MAPGKNELAAGDSVTPTASDLLSRSFKYGSVQLGLLGSFSLHIDAEPIRLPMNAQRLVSFLALHDGLLLRQHVAGSLWGDTTERHAAGSLRSALWRLGHPTHPLVEVADSHLRLSLGVAVDVRESEALARRVLDDSRDLSQAELDVGLLSSDLLPGWNEDWVLVRREYHIQLRLRALETLSHRLSEMGRFGEAVQASMIAVSAEPLRESAQRTLVAAHLADGNVAAAVKQYDSFRELLQDELKLDPSVEMQALVKGLGR
jgi:DNA-binding SARP family transcriptional activator